MVAHVQHAVAPSCPHVDIRVRICACAGMHHVLGTWRLRTTGRHPAMDLRLNRDEIAIAVAAGVTHHSISVALQRRYPNQRGLSSRSVRRFCSREGIHYRSFLSDVNLDRVIQIQVQGVGHSYGRFIAVPRNRCWRKPCESFNEKSCSCSSGW